MLQWLLQHGVILALPRERAPRRSGARRRKMYTLQVWTAAGWFNVLRNMHLSRAIEAYHISEYEHGKMSRLVWK